MEQEVWKDVVGFEGLYQVSNLGRVKSLQSTCNRWKAGRIRKPVDNRHGYLSINLSRDGRIVKARQYVHRLVAEAFVPNDDPINKTEVNHLNEDRSDNRAENLEWTTHADNCNYGNRGDNLSKALKDNPKLKSFGRGRHWFNDGTINIFTYDCPPGFVKGMIKS